MNVAKPWGHEVIYTNSEKRYCLKTLVLKPGHRTSFHRHLVKHETFLIMGGSIVLETEKGKVPLWLGDSIVITPGMWHRLCAPYGAVVVEASTFHSDDDTERRELGGIYDCAHDAAFLVNRQRKLVQTPQPFIGEA